MTTAEPRPYVMLAWLVSGTMFMAQLDSTIIATALPEMAGTFGTTATNLSLGLSVYLLVQAILLPASSWVADRLGARATFTGAVLLFTVASVACGLSAELWQFILARVAQGAAAALMTPVGRVVLIRATPKAELVHILTMTTAPMLLAPMLGPPVGGFIVTYLSWPWVFYLNVPFGLLCVALSLRFIPPGRDAEVRPFDTTGFVLLGLGLSGLIYGFDRITAPDTARAVAWACLVGGLAFTVAAIRHARGAAHPLLSLEPFKSHVFRVIVGGTGALARLPMRALPFVMPLALQIGLGMNAFVAGILLMASAGGDLVLKPVIRTVLRRHGFRDALIWSQVASIATIAALALALWGAPPWAFFVLLAASGLARSLLFSGMSALLYADIDDAQAESATVVWNVVQQVTNAFAISFSVIILNGLAWLRGDYGGHPAIGDFAWTLALLAALGLPALAGFVRLKPDAGASLSGHRQAS